MTGQELAELADVLALWDRRYHTGDPALAGRWFGALDFIDGYGHGDVGGLISTMPGRHSTQRPLALSKGAKARLVAQRRVSSFVQEPTRKAAEVIFLICRPRKHTKAATTARTWL